MGGHGVALGDRDPTGQGHTDEGTQTQEDTVTEGGGDMGKGGHGLEGTQGGGGTRGGCMAGAEPLLPHSPSSAACGCL